MPNVNLNILNLVSDPLFHLVIDQLSDGVLITDHNGVIKYVNSAYARIVDIVAEDILNRKVQEARKGSRLPEVLQTGKPLLGIRRSVNQIDYVADINPIIINGNIAGAISIVRDITQLEQLSKKLRIYSHRVTELKNIVNEMHQAIYSFEDIIGSSKRIEKLKGMARRVAESSVPILILGESGSGKERFAHAIHRSSPRLANPFVAINCAAFPPSLLVSEIFGYEEGSFTGASKGGKLGLFEIANGGTLFLDEIGDMDFELQSKLLRVIETGEFLRIGGTKPIKVDVRIVSATNKNLETLMHGAKFREDLYYRLNVATLRIPPLRERMEDIPELISYHLDSISRKQKKLFNIADEALALLCRYDFPGNIRELVNILEFAASTCEGNLIQPSDLPILAKLKNSASPESTLSNAAKMSERNAIIHALECYGTTVKEKRLVAKHLGISLATLYNKIKQYNIEQRPNLPEK
ncbi:MAG: sigma 54-interacting transcriptional regulator [Negativicutes bacterium]|nr:sigma 54-interacting transcriptional regulator [Negativicutes bacterium]